MLLTGAEGWSPVSDKWSPGKNFEDSLRLDGVLNYAPSGQSQGRGLPGRGRPAEVRTFVRLSPGRGWLRFRDVSIFRIPLFCQELAGNLFDYPPHLPLYCFATHSPGRGGLLCIPPDEVYD